MEAMNLKLIIIINVISFSFSVFCFSKIRNSFPSQCKSGQIEEMNNKSNLLKSQSPFADEITKSMEAEFEKSNAEVVLLGNVGQDVSNNKFKVPSQFFDKKSHKYMHTGLAYKDKITDTWKVIHLLNGFDKCGEITNKSTISNGKLRTFFSSNYKMDILYSIPPIEFQKKLKDAISNAETLHQSDYSAIANPSSDKKQNSNQFILNIIATAQKGNEPCNSEIFKVETSGQFKHKSPNERSRMEAKICAETLGLEPSIVIAPRYQSLALSLAPRLQKNVTISDHSYRSQISNNFPFVSAATVFEYLKKTVPGTSEFKQICPKKIGCDVDPLTLSNYLMDYGEKETIGQVN